MIVMTARWAAAFAWLPSPACKHIDSHRGRGGRDHRVGRRRRSAWSPSSPSMTGPSGDGARVSRASRRRGAEGSGHDGDGWQKAWCAGTSPRPGTTMPRRQQDPDLHGRQALCHRLARPPVPGLRVRVVLGARWCSSRAKGIGGQDQWPALMAKALPEYGYVQARWSSVAGIGAARCSPPPGIAAQGIARHMAASWSPDVRTFAPMNTPVPPGECSSLAAGPGCSGDREPADQAGRAYRSRSAGVLRYRNFEAHRAGDLGESEMR